MLSDHLGHLPKRLAASRKNPISGLVREIRVVIETGKILRIFTNDLNASAEGNCRPLQKTLGDRAVLRWVKQTLKIRHFFGTSQNAVRIQIAVALIAFLLLRLAQQANKLVESPLAFARLIRRQIPTLLNKPQPPRPATGQMEFTFHDRRAIKRPTATQRLKNAA